MQTKFADATPNKPGGDRVIDAPFVFADLEKYTWQLKKEEAWERNDRNSVTIFKTEGVSIVLACLHKNASIKNNSLDEWLTVQVLEGEIDFSVEKKMIHLKAKQLLTLQPGLLHSIVAREETTLLLVTKN